MVPAQDIDEAVGGYRLLPKSQTISVASSRFAAAEEWHQGLAQGVRPTRRENHPGPGMVGIADRRLQQIRDAPCNRRRRIDPGHLPRREPGQAV
jgi:hypothetical protein